MGPGVVVHACNPSSQLQAEMGESGFEASLGKSTDPILQKNKALKKKLNLCLK
jgi:hypothetical protein